MTTKLFISYAKKDTRELALALCDALNTVDGLSAWADRSLRAGRSWELQIQQQIDECDVMIVLYSPDINRHKEGLPESYVLTEIAYAKWTAKKLIIPVMAQFTTAPITLTMEHYIDFVGLGLSVDDLVSALCVELDLPPAELTEIATHTAELERSAEAIRALIGGPFEWCEVPASEFIYGGSDENSAPKQKVTLPTFAIAKYPITFSQFQMFINEAQSFISEAEIAVDDKWWDVLAHRFNELGGPGGIIDDHPRENVNWYDAIAFCRWLSWNLDSSSDLENISQWSVRLPTEYEWEKAARGRNGQLYAWGNEFDGIKCNTMLAAIGKTTSVTQYPEGASPYGVFDMNGNVWEWCLTDYQKPQMDAAKENMSSNSRRTLRGGSWNSYLYDSRTITRFRAYPSIRSNNMGFRIMRPL